ncbi:Hypothetical protein CM240_1031 [Clostridium bornimense]|uniref:Condensation domain-containing protein n=1 Tax=Clostridium bornimense TaxID=1216932 RepID=W6SET1_9CLOT|nr:condensation domain-containing protein [Clostridium bornimense]CDM68195.1 Hypothetical protein CM240_1031 [Clostridium bornimense]
MKKTILYDLTPSQQLMYYSVKYSIKKSVVNIGVSIWIKDKIDIPLLKEAIYIAISRMDALRIRLTEEENITKQYISMDEPKETKVYDFSKLTTEKIDNKLAKWTRKTEKYIECDLYDIAIIKGPDDETIIYFKVNHIIMDAWALTVFTKDILDIYIGIKDNKALSEAPTSFIELVKSDLKYTTSRKREKDYEFWKDTFNTPPSYAAISKENVGKPFRSLSLSSKSKLKVITLEKEKVSKIKKFCRENRLSPQILFLLGSQCYFYLLNNKYETIVNNSLARRSTISSKRAGGMMVNSLPFKVKCSRDSSFIETCNKLTIDQMFLFKHGDFPYQDIMAYIKEQYPVKETAYSYTDMCFTYQLAKINSESDIKYSVKSYSNGISAMGLYLTIMDVSDAGTLDFLFEYTLSVVKEEVIYKIYKLMIRVIELGINMPEISIGEILDLVKGEIE